MERGTTRQGELEDWLGLHQHHSCDGQREPKDPLPVMFKPTSSEKTCASLGAEKEDSGPQATVRKSGCMVLDGFKEKVAATLTSVMAEGDCDQRVEQCLALIQEASEMVELLHHERDEIAKEARSREADAAAHVELVRLKHQQLLLSHETQKKTSMEIKVAHDEMKARVDALEMQHREVVSRLQTTSQQLRHTESALKERTEAYTALKFPHSKSSADEGLAEEMCLIDDLCEELLEHVAAEAHVEEEMSAEIESLRARLEEEEKRSMAAEERAKESERRAEELSAQLAAQQARDAEGRDTDVSAVSQALISPRSGDVDTLRKGFTEAREALRRKDEEIDELHKVLFELRPQLEKEVRGQVRGILEQAEQDAERLREEARQIRDAQAQELETCRHEVDVLKGVVKQRDELEQQHQAVQADCETLRTRLQRLEAQTARQERMRAMPWRTLMLRFAAALAVAALAFASYPALLWICSPSAAARVRELQQQQQQPQHQVRGWGKLFGRRSEGVPATSVSATPQESSWSARMCEAAAKGLGASIPAGGYAHAGMLMAAGVLIGAALSLMAR